MQNQGNFSLLIFFFSFQKLTGRQLEYTAILGKPNLFTYRYSQGVILDYAKKIHGENVMIETIYGIG